MKKLLIIFLLIPTLSFSSIEDISKIYGGKNKQAVLTGIIRKLVEHNFFYAAVPFVKEYLTISSSNSKNIDREIDAIMSQVGVKQFEILPESFLRKSNAPTLKYVLAKKLFRKQKYKEVLFTLSKSIPSNHPAKPFALMLEGSTYSLLKMYNNSIMAYKECIDVSNKQIKKERFLVRKRQLEVNRDYCVIGIPRSQFANKKYSGAYLTYLDLPKDSLVWPEILFEEAWNSFYLKDYNRTLGKLVTYKAPVFGHIFNPEIEVLRTLTFYEMCLWNDVKISVNEFYKKYESNTKSLSKFLNKMKKDYKYFYLLANSYLDGKRRGNDLVNSLLSSVTRDPTYRELMWSFERAKLELSTLKEVRSRRAMVIIENSLKESMILQRNLIGAYVRKSMLLTLDTLKTSFKHMSYIKLEVLNRRKEDIYYARNTDKRERGDITYLKRNSKQYFWDFNGEFWADELGDYVFALRSECRQ